ncbi:response regulator transcription factor [Actinoalloteichus hymeniacidonis]|uniref:Two component transcriptional regulator, LuxR family n=1 Tax=Actinoalloteichus hymeniacidonis TaxID=340345 RepID=A0AAC9N018_9PSEU|nr:response regulator transcription factor [Actinoalloteichus hymeniacidonis]AOS64622.1 hypothetical protein TL08_19155 [Actinoalloteichus hymeniacidonis]MBB5907305.1 DNA-binding NarL/FixJ family response regulator [Actinoalloteichus hymeniacidonis]
MDDIINGNDDANGPGEEPTRVLLLDRQWFTRSAMRSALEPLGDLEIIGEVADCDEALAVLSVGSPLPDLLVLTDADDPEIVLRRLSQDLPAWPVRVLVVGDEPRPGAVRPPGSVVGFLPRWAGQNQFVAAVRLVAAGFCVLPGLFVTGSENPEIDPPIADDRGPLTVREREVLVLLARGHTNAEISTSLGLGESTVKSHVQNLLIKLGIKNRTSAASYAYEVGLVLPQRVCGVLGQQR